MKTKHKYYETVYTKEEGVVLRIVSYVGLIETWMQGYKRDNKKIRVPKFDAYYYNSELTKVTEL